MKNKDIFEAAENGDLKAVKRFVEVDGINLHTKNKEEDTVAHIAAKNLDLDMIEYLVQKDSSLLTVRGQEDLTLLEIAIGINSMTLVKYLVDVCKIDIYQQGDMSHPGTCVHFAAQMCNLQVFRYFIEEKNVDVNLKDVWHQPLAFPAARGPCLNILKYLVETRNANVTSTDMMGRNILSQSAIKCDLTVPKYLLDKRNLNIDTNNAFIIQDAIEYTKKLGSNDKIEEFVKYFVEEKGTDINGGITDTPLHRAAKLGMLEVVKYLVSLGADIRRKDIYQQTPLQVATDEDVIKYLRALELGINGRSRRSLPMAFQFDPSTVCAEIRNVLASRRSPLLIGHAAADRFGRLVDVEDSHFLCNFLLLADAYLNAKSRQRVLFSAQDIIENRMDSIAVDAVHNYLPHK